MTTDYWEDRYASGGTSGKGSKGEFARIKAELVNTALREHGITEVLDIGSGDGVVAGMIKVEDYLGVDPSPTAVRLASARNPLKRFQVLDGSVQPREAHLSLDVLHHLVDEKGYRRHMALLFSARSLVLIWVPDYRPGPTALHSRHRQWLEDVPGSWRRILTIRIPSAPVSFYVLAALEETQK